VPRIGGKHIYDEFDDVGKISKAEANYDSGKYHEQLEQCSLCENWLSHMYTRSHSYSTGACALVAGPIKSYGYCDFYEKGPTFYERYYGKNHPGAQEGYVEEVKERGYGYKPTKKELVDKILSDSSLSQEDQTKRIREILMEGTRGEMRPIGSKFLSYWNKDEDWE